MASVDPDQQAAALPYRVYGLEGAVKTQDAAIDKLQQTTAGHSEALGAQAVTLARHDEMLDRTHAEVIEVKTDVSALAIAVAALAERVASSTSRIAWTLTGFAFTTAASVVVLVLTSPPA